MLQPLLIQGKGRFNCSSLNSPTGATICNETSPECSPYAITVIPGKTYRLGISSVTTLSALSFQIEGHNMTVVEADGHYVDPFVNANCLLMKVRHILGVYVGMIFGYWAMEKANLISIMIQASLFGGSDYGSSLVRFGWTVLPFQADNPRAWAFHCHIEAHFYLGMGVVFAEELRGLGRCRRRSWAA
ncbi:hypothetical protein WN944_023624 [Citrus x changshan-huyou]|uniref:Plastocyanin-like domain-containing protein n=1 Tax=Citrus x changshan-huyou TaxID=2935761 RepID=A0AAP0QX40_9ROSI